MALQAATSALSVEQRKFRRVIKRNVRVLA